MDIKEIQLLKHNLELMIQGKDPKTGYDVEDTILRSSVNKQILIDVVSILNLFLKLDFNPTKIDQRKKYAFYLTPEQKKMIPVSTDPLTISVITHGINALVSPSMRKIKTTQITNWLVSQGYLQVVTDTDGKEYKTINEKSKSIGMSTEERMTKHGRIYQVVTYNENAQMFIIDHLEIIADSFGHFPG